MNHSYCKSLFRNLVLMMLVMLFSSQNLAAQVWIGEFSDRWFHAANWSDGTIPLQPDDDVVIGAPSPTILQQQANLNSIVVESDGIVDIGVGDFTRRLGFGGTAETTLENAGTINVFEQSRLEFRNSVNNSGDINVVSSNGFPTFIEIDDLGAIIDGGGTINLSGQAWISNVNNSSARPTLTIGNQLIQGSGRVGNDVLGIVNSVEGLIEANVSGGNLRIAARENDGGLLNAGVMRASSGGQLEIQRRVFNNNLIEALAGSNVRLANTHITGGTLRSIDSGTFGVAGSVALEDLTFGGFMQIQPGPFVEMVGNFNNTGIIDVNSPGGGTFASLRVRDLVTLAGGGTIRLNGEQAAISRSSSSELLTIENQIIEGQGEIGRGGFDLDLTPNSTINANVPGGRLLVDVSESIVRNEGTLRASNGGTLEFEERVTNVGTIHVEADSLFVSDIIVVGENGRISGSGTIESKRLSDEILYPIDGTIAPGEADSVGTLWLKYANFGTRMQSTARLEIDIASETEFDKFRVTAAQEQNFFSGIELGGTLSVNLLDGFLPNGTEAFTIVSGEISPFCSPLDCLTITRFSNTGIPGFPETINITTDRGEGKFDVYYSHVGVTLLNFNPTNSSTTLDAGHLRVNGSSQIDDIRVSSTSAGEVQVLLNGTVENFTGVTDIEVNGYDDDDVITVSLAGNSFSRVTIRGGCGDDIITLNGSTPSIIWGNDGNDVIFGGSGPDELHGDDDIDELYGRGGADYIDAGFDFIQGPGIHVLEGGSGADIIIGSIGDDDLYGNDGADIIEGLRGDDVVFGGLGNDCIAGGLGIDELRGGSGNDEILGGNGDDFISGDLGFDNLFGGRGDDVIHGGAAADTINGGIGHDQLFGGPGGDSIFGGAFDDFISGGGGPDRLFGQQGDDCIFGNSGNDSLSGGPGIDTLNGGVGTDTGLDTGETETGIEN